MTASTARLRPLIAVLVTTTALTLTLFSCGGGGINPGGADGSAGSDGGGVHPSGQVTTPTEHRPTPPPACAPQSPGSCQIAGAGGCATDSDCTAGLDGRCTPVDSTTCACRYDACLTDADCPSGNDCSCNANRGGAGASGSPTACLPSNCSVDADCGPGGFCSPSHYAGGLGGCGAVWYGYFCHTPNDECGNASDCVSDGSNGVAAGAACIYSQELGHWTCAAYQFCAG